MRPIANIAPKLKMKKYDGSANKDPDSRMPLRFPIVRRATNTRASSTRTEESSGSADVMAATPAAVETATVRM
jgi:hypothetical protein